MNENELLREREKLRQVIQKIEDEKKIIEKSLSSSKNTYDKDDFVRAQLIYMGNKKLKDIKDKKIIIATVGLADPKDEINITNIRNNLKVQLSKEVLDKAKIFHLRGGIDYENLSFAHKTMMTLLYKKTKRMKEEKLTPEDKAIIATYNKQVNFVDFKTLSDIIKEIKK